ncbi:MAG TPA: hypothetical protein VK169_15275 [Saprospiraceae bacterium]|nr:hypothetical protein [Saprospiraceae bacterium]
MTQDLTQDQILTVCKRILVNDIDTVLKDFHIFHIDQVRKFINSVKYHYDIKRMSDEDYKKVDGYEIVFYKERWLLFISNVGYEKHLNYIYESFEQWDYTNELKDEQNKLDDLRERVKNTIKLFDENEEKKQKQVKANVESQILKKQETKFAEKYYSFFHLMLVHEIRTVKEFGRDKNDSFNRNEIENYGLEHYGTRQGFYRMYLDLYEKWNKKSEIAKDLGNGYKAKIIKISGNDNRIIEKLKNFPN